jgi:subtilisin family serine protease
MKPTKLLGFLLLLSLLLAGLSAPAATSPLAQGPEVSAADLSKVDPAVLDQMAVNGQAKFYVILTVQADLSGAAALPTKVAKTTYVFNLLRETARQTQPPLTRYLDQQGLDYRAYYIANMIEVTGGRSAVEWLAARPDVARVVSPPDPRTEPVTRGTAPEDQQIAAVEWNITRVGAPEVWAMGFHGEGMVVADNDTGVEYTHPALVGKYRGNLGGSFNHNYNWWDAWGGSPSPVPTDYDGHGTHTMGTMVGDDGAGNQIGMAPGARWIACAGMNLECFQFFLTPWDLNGQNPDPSKAPDAINNSWYDPSGFDYRPIVQALNAAGIAVIKSAGNTGPNCSTISNPGQVPEIIATAAFAQGDTIASFSARGPMSSYGSTILKPEVAAPGVNVRSSVPGGGYEGGWNGTSMAAPHSTGLVALIWSAAPCIQGDVPLTKQIMMETAEAKINAQCPPFVDHPNDVWGWGILDAEAAVQMAMGYCAGQGGLEGTVTSSSSPLEGVEVLAQAAGGYSKTDVTDATGFYAMAVFSDTYTVTATKYGYQTAVFPGVEVVADVTTTLDIDMPALPEYTVSGTVRDAATLAPLAATVESLDAPVPPVNTDPATGFYSIDVAEGTWHLQATSSNHAPQTVEVAVTGNVSQDFSLSPICDVFADDVEGGNLGWTVQSPWAITAEASHSPTHAWTDSPGGNYANSRNVSLTSPVFDLSDYTGVTLSFWHIYDTEPGWDFCYVEYSINGGSSWTVAATYDGYDQTIWMQEEIPLSALDGQANARIRFHFTSDSSNVADGWHVDDVALIGGGPSCGCEAVGILDVGAEVSGCTATFSADLAGTPPFTYAWDFSAFGVSTDPAPIIDLSVSGTYPYSLTVTNCDGASSDTVTDTVTVDCCDDVHIPGFSWEPVSPLEDQEVVFTGVASGTAPISFAWDYGDGNFGTGQAVAHTYAAGGAYTVVMTATNCAGSEATSTQTITVRSKVYIYLPIVVRGE